MPITVSFNGGSETTASAAFKELEGQLRAGFAVSATALSGVTKDWLTSVVAKLAAKHGGSWPGGTGTDTLSRRSGGLLKQLQDGITVTGGTLDTLTGTLYGGDYAALQEFGGTVSAKGGQYLAIPLPAAMNSDGTPKKDSARDWEDTFVQKTKAGNLVVFQRNLGGIIPLYVLKTSVNVPARLGAGKMAADQMPYFVEKAVDAVMSSFKFAT